MKSGHPSGVVGALPAWTAAALAAFALAGCGGGGGSPGTGDAQIAVSEQPSAPTPNTIRGGGPAGSGDPPQVSPHGQ